MHPAYSGCVCGCVCQSGQCAGPGAGTDGAVCVAVCVRAGSVLGLGLALTGLCVWLCVRAGSVLGLGLALTGLCQEGTADSRTHLATLWDRLGSLLDNTSPQDSTYQVRIVMKTPLTRTAPIR